MPVRVLSIPPRHPYIDHIQPLDGTDAQARVDYSWNPRAPWEALRLPRLAELTAGCDVVHLHFGFDALSPSELETAADHLREQGIPLIYTLHDLRNPHHREPGAHHQQLAVLARRSDAVLALTPGSAAKLGDLHPEARIHLLPHPHPHVVPLSRPRKRASPPSSPRVVGVHLKSFRPNMEPGPVLDALSAFAGDPRVEIRVDLHTEAIDGPRAQPETLARLRELDARGAIELSIHPYFSDDALWDYLESLDVSVLPYRFGTHSGWLEACRDLGTRVVAPDCGYYAEQAPGEVLEYSAPGTPGSVASLRSAVERATELDAPERISIERRRRERQSLAEAHRSLYARLISRGGSRPRSG